MRTTFICLLTIVSLTYNAGAIANEDHGTANFTGPLLTANAATLPKNALLLEPYLIYTRSDDAYNANGNHQRKSASSGQWQTLLPISYGLTDRLQLQVVAGMARARSAGMHTDGFKVTDTSLSAQYMFLAPTADGTRPALSISYTHRFPTGAYDHLNANPLNGIGSGASVDRFAFLLQQYTWLSNGRPIRWRATLAYAPAPQDVHVAGMSVYGTAPTFRGRVGLGRSISLSTSAEYSFDPHWVLAMDLTYDHAGRSRLHGVSADESGYGTYESQWNPAGSVYSVAPAVEYNVNDRIGVVAGVQFSFAGRNNDAFVSPQVAVNMVF